MTMSRIGRWLLLAGLGCGMAGAAMAEDKPSLDWAAMGRFQAENAALGAPAAGEARVVFMGDSITEFWSKAPPDPFRGPGAWINRGISGQTTPQMLLRLRPDVLALKPRVLVILGGTNDIAGNTGPVPLETIEGHIASMAELASAHGVRVVLASVLPASRYYWAPEIQPAPRIAALNQWLREYAARQGHVWLDYYSPLVDANGGLRREFGEDGVHPNEAGYRVMLPLAQAAVRQALAR